METIPFDVIHSWWDGKVKIRKMKPFEDSRGLLLEILRSDSDTFKNVVNLYISETKPFIKRGPHEHTFQDDEFITWNSRMVYEFYNPDTNESKYFTTEPNGIFGVYVEHGIHHGYRNLDSEKISYTFNGLNKLYKGVGRNDPPDEIRHEKNTTENEILFIFGAGGKLGTALTEVAYDVVKKHTFEIVPYFDKILNKNEFQKFVEAMDFAFKDKKITFINCAALTNTKDTGPLNEVWTWANISLPILFEEMCNKRNWNFVQLSTNYVYHKVKPQYVNYFVSTYTQSKKDMEVKFNESPFNKSTTLLRVSNLYSLRVVGDDNIFSRFNKIISETNKISVDPNEKVAPTDTSLLASKIIELFLHKSFNTTSLQKINIISKDYNLDQFVKEFFNITPEITTSKIDGGFNEFSTDPKAKIIRL